MNRLNSCGIQYERILKRVHLKNDNKYSTKYKFLSSQHTFQALPAPHTYVQYTFCILHT